jgi:predicted amidophosphoribosyltransferase
VIGERRVVGLLPLAQLTWNPDARRDRKGVNPMRLWEWLRLGRHPHVECPECGETVLEDSCARCGYELVRRSKAEATPKAPA